MSSIETIITQSLAYLKQGLPILYPTDTVWGIGCDATNVAAVEKIYEIKKRVATKSLIVLVSDLEMLREFIPKIPTKALNLVKNTTEPTTIIYENPIGLAENLVAADHSVGIRIVQDEFCQALIKTFGKPIVSTSANISGSPTPQSFKEITPSIINNVSYIAQLKSTFSKKPSRIIKVSENAITIIRE